jgi:hypothetical protein
MRIVGLIIGAILIFLALAISLSFFVEYPDDFQAGIPEAEQQAQFRIYVIAWSIAAAIGAGGIIIIVYSTRSSGPSLYQPDRSNSQ